MQVMDQGKDKVKKICEALRDETLKPAQLEAESIVKASEKQAEQIVAKAQKEAEKRLEKAQAKIEEEKAVLASALSMACKQAVGALKQAIEEKIMGTGIALMKESEAGAMTEKFIDAVAGTAKGAESIEVPAGSMAKAVATLGLKEEQVIETKGLKGGIKMKLKDEHLVLDLSDTAVAELLATYVRADFRKLIFGEGV